MNEERFEEVLKAARAHSPCDVGRAGFGLETRVLARLREEGASVPGLLEEIGRWGWRCALGLAPVVALLVAWFCLWSGLSVETFPLNAAGDLAGLLTVSFL